MKSTRAARGAQLLLSILLIAVPGSLCGQSTARPEPSDWFAGDPHLHRGIGYLAAPHKIGSISDLVKLATHKGSVSAAVLGPELHDVRDGEELVSP